MFSVLRDKVFLATTLIPSLLAAAYFGFIASDQYVSESRFVVRRPELQPATALGSFFKAAGFSKAQDDSYIVQDYIVSRDALLALNRKLGLKEAFSRSSVDLFSRFAAIDRDDSFEALHRYYLRKVSVQMDAASSIVTLTARAYTAHDAHAINVALLQMSEGLVNGLNVRGRKDLIRSAEEEVREAQRADTQAAEALARYRIDHAIVDPEKEAAIHMQQIAKLNEELVATRSQVARLEKLAEQSALLPVLRQQVQFLEGEIRQETRRLAGERDASLVGKAVQYQRLAQEKELASKLLATAMSGLEKERSEAQKQQLYLERVVEPSVPDVAQEPHRLRSVAIVFVLGLVGWGIVNLLLASLREHRS